MIPVEGHKNLFRDEKTGAIINMDTSGYNNYMSDKRRNSDKQAEIDAMKGLENRTMDSKIEMDVLDALDEISAINRRHQRVDTDKLLETIHSKKEGVFEKHDRLTDDEIKTISDELGVDEKSVKEMESRLSSTDMSFDPPTEANDEEASFSPAGFLADETKDPADLIEREDSEEYSHELLHKALSALDSRSKEILIDRWLQDQKLTLHELADKYGVSAERIRQIEKAAMEKVKSYIS